MKTSNIINEIAKDSNVKIYDVNETSQYFINAPHLRHKSVLDFFVLLVDRVIEVDRLDSRTPTVLDIGAGEGTLTKYFLAKGANVTAVDISISQINELKTKCYLFHNRLKCICQDVNFFLNSNNEHFDIIVVNSFLHHVPDYVSVINQCLAALNSKGILFTFQDPLFYATIPISHFVDKLGYYLWRVFQGNYIRGLKTICRRLRGIYDASYPEDFAEFHVVRKGMDHGLLLNHISGMGFKVEFFPYWSNQNRLVQYIGEKLLLKNMFSLICHKRD